MNVRASQLGEAVLFPEIDDLWEALVVPSTPQTPKQS
jgi:hypothetical protein